MKIFEVISTLPRKIDVTPMPTPPQAPTAQTPDGVDDNGVQIKTTAKGNRSVASGQGTYIFSPQGKLMLYMTPKIGGLQQTHNIDKKTVTVNFGNTIDGTSVDQKATYDMNGNIISDDNLSMAHGDLQIGLDKEQGPSMDFQVAPGVGVSANSRGITVNRNNRP